MTKNGSYVITPLLEDGVTDISFYEGRGNRSLTLYTSTDGGDSWTLLETVTTQKEISNTTTLNSATVNRIKLANESGGDADIDNLNVTVYPTGDAPIVSTLPITNIGKNTASSGGNVISEGTKAVIERGLCWNIGTLPLIADNRITAEGTTGSFSLELSGLPAGRQIYVRAYAISRSGTGYGNEVSFTTAPATIPVVTTQTAFNITAETAQSGGVITDTGGAPMIAQGICWSTHSEPTTNDFKTTDETGNASFTTLLQGLTPNTRYYYRAYAQNQAGTGYGMIESFETGSIEMPAVTTSAAIAATSYKVKAGGIIINTGNAPVVCGLCWNTTRTPTVDDNKTIATPDEMVFTDSIGNLKGSTTYFIRAYVTNSAGTTYGEEVSATTTNATVFYVSPQGDDTTADGSMERPFYNAQKAIDLATAGDTIYMLGGTYHYSVRINIKTVG